jgi:hypothetical protein
MKNGQEKSDPFIEAMKLPNKTGGLVPNLLVFHNMAFDDAFAHTR